MGRFFMANDKKNAASGGIRIQKFLSLAGIASRRHAEEMIAQGRVKVSGRVVTEMGVHVIPGKSRVEVDNKPVFYSEERNYVLFHKPAECITTLDDPEQRTTVIDLLPKSMPRVFPVGRLDWDTEGLLLLTNDGDLAYRLMHPGVKVPRVYHAKVRGELKDTSPEFKKLQFGVELEDGLAKPDRVSIIKFTGNNTWVEIELHIGRNRIVRRMFDAIGFPVMKLRRVAFGNLTLDGLALGAFRDLTEAEVAELYAMVGEPGNEPVVRSKSGVRYARGFDPKDRTMPRESAPAKEDLLKRDAGRKAAKDERERRRAQREFEAPRYEPDETRSFASTWDKNGEDYRDRKSFPRDEERRDRKSFPRNEERRDRKSFPRDEERRDRKSFPLDEERRDRKSFPRDEQRNRKPFEREIRGDRKPFEREIRGDRKPFERENRGDRKPFEREIRGDRKPFEREIRGDRKPFEREIRGDRKPFERDERPKFGREKTFSSEKKRPFAKGIRPKSGPRR